jgi:hypothetical protein
MSVRTRDLKLLGTGIQQEKGTHSQQEKGTHSKNFSCFARIEIAVSLDVPIVARTMTTTCASPA